MATFPANTIMSASDAPTSSATLVKVSKTLSS